MLILMKTAHTVEQLAKVVEMIEKSGWTAHVLPGEHSVAVGITGNQMSPDAQEFMSLAGVQKAMPVSKPYKLSGRGFKSTDTIIEVGAAKFGGNNFVTIGGPCAVESLEQTIRIAKAVKERGAVVLRGGAFKPRSSTYSFQGLGEAGLKILAQAREETGLPVITEALDMKSLDLVEQYADIIQIGTRNAQNFSLLKAVGQCTKPVMLKRGFASTIDEWLMAAEYIIDSGNPNVILCERGVRSFDSHTRNLLDLTAVATIRDLSHLPVMVDPSHSTGRRDRVIPMSRAAIATGAHAIIVDVHDRPEEALCDGPQALSFEEFDQLVQILKALAKPLEVDFCVDSQ